MFNSNLSVFELELIHWLNNVFCVSLLDLDFYSDLCFDQHYLFQGFKSMILIYCQFLLIEIGFFLFEGNNSNFLLSSMICFWLAYSINIIKNLDSSLWLFSLIILMNSIEQKPLVAINLILILTPLFSIIYC